MRIVIDMQGAQTESRFRGIGRYTMSFTKAIVRNCAEHEIILSLSGFFPETVEPIRAAFIELLPQENIRIWHAPGPVMEAQTGNAARRQVAELLYASFLTSLKPDVIHISSLFEGYTDNGVTSIGRLGSTTPVSVCLYDIIPLLNPEQYLKPDPRYARYYGRKIGDLKKAALYLAISEFSRQESLAHLKMPESCIVNVSAAIDPDFKPLQMDDIAISILSNKFGLKRPFILYTGGGDERKNLQSLIQAYAALPSKLRKTYQLVIAGRIHCAPSLLKQAKFLGLNPNTICFTGFITDKELIQLYNICHLFVFPSLHEGFGLPALEAMACGAPVIGSNTSSLPEVIGLDHALFDPLDVNAITLKMVQALEDEPFRDFLKEHGLLRAKNFSWDESAKRAIMAFESVHAEFAIPPNSYIERSLYKGKFLQTVAQPFAKSDDSTLVALAASIALNETAGLERQLMLDISELAQRDAATGVQRVVRSYLKALLENPPADFRVEPVYATPESGYRYARQFTLNFLGQSEEGVTDDLVQWQGGDLFFGLDMQHHVQLANKAFYQQLRQEGVIVKFLIYDLLPIQLNDFFQDPDAIKLHEQWLAMIAGTDGAVCISKATADAYDNWITANELYTTPHFEISWVHLGADIDNSKPSKGIPVGGAEVLDSIRSRISFLCVATIEPRKRHDQILGAIELLWKEGLDINLIFVGRQGWQLEHLADIIRNHRERDRRLYWLQGISDEYLEQIYSASTCLIAASINEGFGLPLIEAARHCIPIVARDIPVFREVAGDAAFYFIGETPRDLATELKAWIELYQEGFQPKSEEIRWLTWQASTEKLKAALFQKAYQRRQLLVDVSELVQHDARTGIQRVVRSILKQLLVNPPENFRVEPVYATIEQEYRYAHAFKQEFLGCPVKGLKDEPIEYAPGDIFFGLDLNHHVPRVHEAYLETMHRDGVRIIFAVYDLIPINFPHFYESQHSVHLVHKQWLSVITKFDGAMCISKAVADELTQWHKENCQKRHRPFKIDWFHLGADLKNSEPTKRLPSNADTILESLGNGPSFLMVGTLEPRKGHEQVLDAFEKLWQSGEDPKLVIVGKQGWMMDNFVGRLCNHPELDKHLFWLESISDEFLEKVYQASTCLIAASYGEGFGLPLIEAAQHNKPIIARDIPVFREVTGEHAFYFNSKIPGDLAQAITEWEKLHAAGRHPKSNKMPWLTWKESAAQLVQRIIDDDPNSGLTDNGYRQQRTMP